jgi:hypothetical protein
MPSEALIKYGTVIKPTITLTSLANGAGRVSTDVVNTGSREEMERDVNAMHSYGLWATLQKS